MKKFTKISIGLLMAVLFVGCSTNGFVKSSKNYNYRKTKNKNSEIIVYKMMNQEDFFNIYKKKRSVNYRFTNDKTPVIKKKVSNYSFLNLSSQEKKFSKNNNVFTRNFFCKKNENKKKNITKNKQKENYSNKNDEPDPPKIETFGLTGFILGSTSLFVPIFFIPIGILAIIFGVVSLERFSKKPDKYYGKGYAIGAIALGILGIIMNIFFLALILRTGVSG